LRRRGELVERSFVHCYDTGGMRRTHLRKHTNILKRQLIHVAGFNLSLNFRKLLGAGTPRELNNWAVALFGLPLRLLARLENALRRNRGSASSSAPPAAERPAPTPSFMPRRKFRTCTTGC
jgi:hypothetical protein